jgi:hypothetical protein
MRPLLGGWHQEHSPPFRPLSGSQFVFIPPGSEGEGYLANVYPSPRPSPGGSRFGVDNFAVIANNGAGRMGWVTYFIRGSAQADTPTPPPHPHQFAVVTDMKLHKDSPILWWAYPERDSGDPPHHVNLCPLFWRVVLIAPLVRGASLVTTVVIVVTIAPLIWVGDRLLEWRYPGLKGIEVRWRRREFVATQRYQRRLAQGKTATWGERRWVTAIAEFVEVIGGGLKSLKGKVCPVVEIEGFPPPVPNPTYDEVLAMLQAQDDDALISDITSDVEPFRRG